MMSASTPAGPARTTPRPPSDQSPVHPRIPTPGRWATERSNLQETSETLRDVRAELALLIERLNQ